MRMPSAKILCLYWSPRRWLGRWLHLLCRRLGLEWSLLRPAHGVPSRQLKPSETYSGSTEENRCERLLLSCVHPSRWRQHQRFVQIVCLPLFPEVRSPITRIRRDSESSKCCASRAAHCLSLPVDKN